MRPRFSRYDDAREQARIDAIVNAKCEGCGRRGVVAYCNDHCRQSADIKRRAKAAASEGRR